MQEFVLLLSLISLPLGEARVNGLADACVTMADQPLALFVNPALLTKNQDRKLLYNPIGYQIGSSPVDLPFLLNVGFLGYSQPIGQFGTGLAGYRDEEGGSGILAGAAYKLGFLHAGASLGIRYEAYGTLPVRPAIALGAAAPSIKFADVPGEITIAACARWIDFFNIQAGIDYSIAFFRFMANFNAREPFLSGNQESVRLAALFKLDDLVGFPLEFGGGWGSDNNRFGVLLASDLNLCRINLSYSDFGYGNGRIGLSLLFSIASTKEVAERLAAIETEQKTKNEITSKTYTTQGISLYKEGDYEAALSALDIALIWDPANKEALSWLERVRNEKNASELTTLISDANASMKSQNYLDALRKAQEALKIDSSSAEAKFLSQESQRKFSQMVLSQTSSAHNSGEISALYQQGLEQYTSGDYKSATETWGKIEKLQPKSTTVQTYQRQTADRITEQITQGMSQLEVLERKGRWREALTLANRLHELAPSNKEISAKVTTYQSKISSLISEYQTQGVDFYNRGYYVSAQNSFYSILALDPNNSSAKDYLARMKGKIEKKNANELYLLGVQAYTNNQYEQAIQYWQQVLEIDSSFDNAAKNIQRARDKLAQLK
ncbi:hypothetical protein GX441_11240 [bacterium]|nr:hypothetical protein [bacterium]